MNKIWMGVSAGLTLAALVEWAWIATDAPPRPRQFASMTGSWVQAPQPVALPDFQLVGDHDRPFRRQDLRGGWHLLVFGYTSCRDVCPTTLSILARTLRGLQAKGSAPVPQVVFISVDPDHDTPAHLAEYVAHFNSAFQGVTGSPDELKRLIHGLGSDYHLAGPDAAGMINHPTSLFLVDPKGRLAGLFSHATLPDKLGAEIKVALKPDRTREQFAP